VSRSNLGSHSGNRVPSLVQHGFLWGRRRDLLRSMKVGFGVPCFLGFPKPFGDAQLEMGERHGRVWADLLGGLPGELVSPLITRDT